MIDEVNRTEGELQTTEDDLQTKEDDLDMTESVGHPPSYQPHLSSYLYNSESFQYI